jgi:hypothetical protein
MTPDGGNSACRFAKWMIAVVYVSAILFFFAVISCILSTEISISTRNCLLYGGTNNFAGAIVYLLL